MDAEDGAALVAGGASAAPAAGVRIRVLRSFRWGEGVLRAGDEATIADARDARALATWGKAEILAVPATEPAAGKSARRRPAKETAE